MNIEFYDTKNILSNHIEQGANPETEQQPLVLTCYIPAKNSVLWSKYNLCTYPSQIILQLQKIHNICEYKWIH